MTLTKIKLFSVTSVNFGFILNVTILIIWTTGIFKSAKSWYCIECCSKIFHFNKNFLTCCLNTDNSNTHWIDLGNDHNTSLSFRPSSSLELLVKQFNNATPENSNNREKVCSSKYYDKCITLKHLTKINSSPCFI